LLVLVWTGWNTGSWIGSLLDCSHCWGVGVGIMVARIAGALLVWT
jgi:hypothetical protein